MRRINNAPLTHVLRVYEHAWQLIICAIFDFNIVVFFVCIVSVLPALEPKFAEPIPNVTIPVGRDVSLPCVVSNLGNYKVFEFPI